MLYHGPLGTLPRGVHLPASANVLAPSLPTGGTAKLRLLNPLTAPDDGDRFALDATVQGSFTFEWDSGGGVLPGSIALPFLGTEVGPLQLATIILAVLPTSGAPFTAVYDGTPGAEGVVFTLNQIPPPFGPDSFLGGGVAGTGIIHWTTGISAGTPPTSGQGVAVAPLFVGGPRAGLFRVPALPLPPYTPPPG